MTRKQIEREQIEWVFVLTGGELADKPWRGSYLSRFGGWAHCVHHYWYDDTPEYAERELKNAEHWNAEFITLITWGGGFLDAPPAFVRRNRIHYKLVATYTNSGETECPQCQRDDRETTPLTRRERNWSNGQWECSLCEEYLEPDRTHPKRSFIYIGEGYEAVYRRIKPSEVKLDESE